MDRQIVIASFMALTLATTIKVLAPVELPADSSVASTSVQAFTVVQPANFAQPDTIWLVGP